MDTQFQDLQWVIDRCLIQFKREPNRRLSSLFRQLRKNPHFTLLGDYGILWAMAKTMDIMGKERIRKQFYNAAKQSPEFKENRKRDKALWLDNLVGVL